MNNNENWIQEYVSEKMKGNSIKRERLKPPTNYGIGFVQMNRSNNRPFISSHSKPPLKPLTLNALLKNSLRFENVIKRNKVRPTISRTSSVDTDRSDS